MTVLDAFLATWSQARNTFGAGVPQTGEVFDQSAQLSELSQTVRTAAPGRHWSGGAALAYHGRNTAHAEVIGTLARLDRQLSAHVTESARVVATGRQNLDAIRSWVLAAAQSVPPGPLREQMLAPIVAKGLSRVSQIVTGSNGRLNEIGGKIQLVGTEFVKAGTGEGAGGPDLLGGDDEQDAKDVDEAGEQGSADGESLADGELSAAEAARLQQATTLTPEQQAALDAGSLTIPPQQMSYLAGLSQSLDGKSPQEIKAILDQLPPEQARAVSNGLHLIGSDTVHAAGANPASTPGDPGYVPASGGAEHLPDSIREVFDAPLLNDPTGEWKTMPDGSKIHLPPDYNQPYKYLEEYRAIAAIADYGDPNTQRGSALNDGLLAESRELLEHYQSDRWPNYDDRWAHENLDPTLQQLLQSASDDPTAVHDAIVGRDGNSPATDFIKDLYEHDWADNGAAAGALFPEASDHSARAGQTMHTFDAYAGEKYRDLLNLQGGDSLAQVNPELVRALATANVPYLDDMAGVNRDGTQGFGPLDPGANSSTMRGLFAVLDGDEIASNTLNGNASRIAQEYLIDYGDGLANGAVPDGELLQANGKLLGAMDMGEYIHQLDSGKDSYQAAQAAYDKRAAWYDLGHGMLGAIPGVKDGVDVYDAMPGDPLRQLFIGDPPTRDPQAPMTLRELDDITKPIAAYLVEENVGDLSLLGGAVVDGHLDLDPDNQHLIDSYMSSVSGNNDLPYLKWVEAYGNATYVSDGEFDDFT